MEDLGYSVIVYCYRDLKRLFEANSQGLHTDSYHLFVRVVIVINYAYLKDPVRLLLFLSFDIQSWILSVFDSPMQPQARRFFYYSPPSRKKAISGDGGWPGENVALFFFW